MGEMFGTMGEDLRSDERPVPKGHGPDVMAIRVKRPILHGRGPADTRARCTPAPGN